MSPRTTRTAQIVGTTPRQDAMVALMMAAGRLQQALEEVCGRHGITHDQYNVLRILRGAHPVGHPRYAIADRLISRAPDVTRLLGRLVRSGLVERYRSEEDQRLSMSRATDLGLRLLETLDPEILAVHDRLSGDLDEAELRQLSASCGRVATSPVAE
jgi:DNA-binding MarR family transcriptional regulator